MPDPSPLPSALRGGAFSVADARALGVSASRLRAGDLQTPFRGVRTPEAPRTLRERCRAHDAASSDGLVYCGPTAALLIGIPLPARLENPEILHVLQRWTDRAPRGVGIVGHKTRLDVEVAVVDGIRCTAAVPTWFALATLVGHDDLVVAGDALVGGRRPMIAREALARAVDAHSHARGAARVREAFADVRAGSWSPRETRVRLALISAGLPEPELNAPIDLPSGRRYHGDLVYRRERLVLEYEGRHHHSDVRQWAHDLDRYNAMAENGWTVLRMAHELPLPDLVARVRRILAR